MKYAYCTYKTCPVQKYHNLCSDINCPVLPPDVPTSLEYTLPADDGYVSVQSVIYPTYPNIIRNDQSLNSTHPRAEIPRNFKTNLTWVLSSQLEIFTFGPFSSNYQNLLLFRYYCGSARQFKNTPKTYQASQQMTCNWNRTWTPTSVLWVTKM